ncbi:MAG: hypothetical protein HYS25_03465 [Ignavibacteriales bacterium]|nr:hypothetical protein [Ignavibacteriales bacterium]
MRLTKIFSAVIILFAVARCSSVVLQPADFSWPVEDVLKADDKGLVEEQRYTFSVNVKPLFFEEFADSNLAAGKEIRIIRDKLGYYYITGSNFKNVYLFLPTEGGLKLEEKINLSATGLTSPVMNQKSPNIEILDGTNKYLLNNKGLVR